MVQQNSWFALICSSGRDVSLLGMRAKKKKKTNRTTAATMYQYTVRCTSSGPIPPPVWSNPENYEPTSRPRLGLTTFNSVGVNGRPNAHVRRGTVWRFVLKSTFTSSTEVSRAVRAVEQDTDEEHPRAVSGQRSPTSQEHYCAVGISRYRVMVRCTVDHP